MKRGMKVLPVMLAVFALWACAPSKIQSNETNPEGVTGDVVRVSKSAADETKKETMESTQSTYSIPADAPTGVNGGPGMMQTNAVNDKANYPADKQIIGDQSGTSVCLYSLGEYGISQLFDTVDTADANTLVASMVTNQILADGTTVEDFSVKDGVGTLKLNQLKGVYDGWTEEKIVACVVNTFTDNLNLTSVNLTAGGKDYGNQTYTDKYDAT